MKNVKARLILSLMLVPGILCAEAFPGFSIQPPTDPDWQQVQRNAQSAVWMRRAPDYEAGLAVAILTSALTIRFDDDQAFLDWVRRSKDTNPDPARFRISDSAYEIDTTAGPRCVRYRTVVEDRPNQRVLEVAGLACLHPDAPGRYFDIQYSARFPAGVELPATMFSDGAGFVDSFRFSPPPADDDWSLAPGAPMKSRKEAA
ncbi:MAG: hypothetical protein WBN31_09555 [Gammaproteobacteria bacterium]